MYHFYYLFIIKPNRNGYYNLKFLTNNPVLEGYFFIMGQLLTVKY